mmetsp:Transcript_42492/g.102337  ORF Transcript_42492/g.102337 Transcript_42492/m.102337 type:complete len:220 (+) Transcript_42492:54-713(+)
MRVALAVVPAVSAVVGVDVSNSVSESEFSCLRTPGGQGAVEFVIARVYQSVGDVDPDGAQTIKNAKAAGIQNVDGYIFPCVSCGDAAGQVSATVDHLRSSGADFGMLWYDIENYHWGSQGSNQAFIKEMVDEGKKLGIKAGIYTNYNNWATIVGAGWNYPASQGLPVWYAHYDGSASFSDFGAFGGWSKPNIKQYLGDKSSCGVGVDYNWYPAGEDVVV